MEQRTPKFKYIQSDKNKKIDEKRNEVGPGYLKDLEKSLMAVEPKSPGPIFLKSKKVSKFQKDAEKMKFVPGVGAYENVEKAFKKFVITKKDGNVFTSRARLVRSTERAEKDKRWVPGPGSYNAISFFKEKG